MSVSVGARKELWKWTYGREAFRHSVDACEQILNLQIKQENPLYCHLNVSAVICYARPFKRPQHYGPIEESIVPASAISLHKEIIRMRDKVYAHVDAPGSAHEKNKSSGIFYDVMPSGRDLHIMGFTINPAEIQKTRDLGVTLRDICHKNMLTILKQNRSSMPTEPGFYAMGLSPHEADFWKL